MIESQIMKFIFLILIILIGFYSFKLIWIKAELKKLFQNYKKDFIKVTSSLNNLQSKDLDKLSLSGFNLVICLLICLLPYFISYIFILKIIKNYNLALIISSFIFIPFLFNKK